MLHWLSFLVRGNEKLLLDARRMAVYVIGGGIFGKSVCENVKIR